MRMKVQFKAVRAFTFFLGVVVGCNNAFTSAQYLDFQDQPYPPFGNVPYSVRCNWEYHGTLDNPVPYPTRCTAVPNSGGPPRFVNPLASLFGMQNLDAVNTPYSAELSPLPNNAKNPSVTFFTREPIAPYLIGKPAEEQKIQTFSFRQADVNQEEPHVLFDEFLPFQRTKQSRRQNDESEHSSSANRNQHFVINKNFPFDSNHPLRRYNLLQSIFPYPHYNPYPNHFLEDSFHKQFNKHITHGPIENELTKSQVHSSPDNRPLHSFTSPSSETPETSPSKTFEDIPSSASSSEEQKDSSAHQDTSSPSFSELQENPLSGDTLSPYSFEEEHGSFFPEELSSPYLSEEVLDGEKDPLWPYFSEEHELPFYVQYTEPPSFPEEQKPSLRDHFLPPLFPQEQEYPSVTFPPPEHEDSSFPHYTPYAEPPPLAFVVPDETPFMKPLPWSQDHDALTDALELLEQQKINERPNWYDDSHYKKFGWGIKHKDNEDIWSPVIRRRHNTILSKIQRALRGMFHFPTRAQTRND